MLRVALAPSQVPLSVRVSQPLKRLVQGVGVVVGVGVFVGTPQLFTSRMLSM
jgi:hypothetical protein